MVRPRRFRRVLSEPDVTFFKPAGVRLVDLEETVVSVEEFEAVRLKDFERLDQNECAKKMNVSQPTFHRLILSARKKIAEAIVKGKAIKIEGGTYKLGGEVMFNDNGKGRMKGFALGPGGNCICPNCGTKAAHYRGIPCLEQKCPKCGSQMTRER